MFYTEEDTKKRDYIKIYKVLQQNANDNNLDVKERWELETNTIITDEDCEETFKSGYKLTSSPTWKEFDWKVKMQYFNTPSVTSKYSDTSELYWRGCGLVGDFTHLFLDCPKLQEFWKNVQEEIKKILGINFEMDPALFILGIRPEKSE